MKTKITRIMAFVLCLLLTLSLVACGSSSTGDQTNVPSTDPSITTEEPSAPPEDSLPETREVVDLEGNTVEIPYTVNRLVATGRFIQEIIMLGGADLLVAQADIASNQSSEMLYLIDPDLESLPIVFGNTVSEEELLKANPDVAITKNGDDAEAIAALGIPTVGVKNKDTPKDEVSLIAEVIGGDAIDIAAKYCEYYDATFDYVSSKTASIPDDQKLKVYVGGGNDGTDLLATEASNDIVTRWIEAAGGINVATDETAEVNGNQFSIESVIKWDPDVIIVTAQAGKDLLETSEQWKDISAVKNGNIYVCPMGLYLWSVRSAEGVLMPMWAGQVLYPDLFTDLDMAQEVKDFYSEYYHFDLTDEQVDAILYPGTAEAASDAA